MEHQDEHVILQAVTDLTVHVSPATPPHQKRGILEGLDAENTSQTHLARLLKIVDVEVELGGASMGWKR